MTEAETAEVIVERRDAVAVVYLNRPAQLNAMTASMGRLYAQTLRELDADSSVRAIVVTGSGRGFCAGADLSVFAGGAEAVRELVPPAPDLPLAIRLRKPIIAAVNGPVAGIGFAYMMGADIRFIAAEAKISTTFARLGLVAEYGLSWLLPRVVGVGRALDLLLSARTVTGTEAASFGLAEFVVPVETVLEDAVAYAADVAANCSPTSMAVIKSQVDADLESGFADSLQRTLKLMSDSFSSPDVAEALAARPEKRAPSFAPLT